MEAERWREIERLYHLALEREESARAPFLEQACAGDKSLEQAVLSLLEHAEETGSFLEEPALEVAAKELAMSGAIGVTAARPRPRRDRAVPHYSPVGRRRNGDCL